MSIFKNRPVASALALAMAVGVPASFYAAPTPVEAAAGDLDQAVAALRGISTMKANFVQTDRNGQAVSGVMTLKRPGKIRFEYEKGVPLLVVSNGKSMYMIDYEVNQVQRWPINNSPLGALLDLVVPNPSTLFDDARRQLSHQQTGQRSLLEMFGSGATTDTGGGASSFEDAMFATSAARPAPAPKKPRRGGNKRA